MHIGFGEFCDSETELWHSENWTSSFQTTSGQYAHIDKELIFFSNFVIHICLRLKCSCHYLSEHKPHLGRILAIGKNYRLTASNPGDIILKMQTVYRSFDLITALNLLILQNELVFIENIFSFLPENSIVSFFPDIMLNYSFQSRVKNINQRQTPRSSQFFV